LAPLCVVFQLLVGSGSECTAKAAPPSSSISGWTITQSSNFIGFLACDMTPVGFRMKFDKLGITLIAKAPLWQGYVYNDQSHKYCEMTMEQWTKRFTLGRTGNLKGKNGELLLVAKKTGKTSTILGLKSFEWKVFKKSPLPNEPEQLKMVFWLTPDISPPKQIGQIFSGFLQLPLQKGMLLRASHDNYGRIVPDLDTLEAKKATFQPAIFEPRKGYTKVKDEMQLIMDESTDDMIGGALDTAPTTVKHPMKP
jgi:hypothetical protein